MCNLDLTISKDLFVIVQFIFRGHAHAGTVFENHTKMSHYSYFQFDL